MDSGCESNGSTCYLSRVNCELSDNQTLIYNFDLFVRIFN